MQFRENKSHIAAQGVVFENVGPGPGTVLRSINIALSEHTSLGLKDKNGRIEGPYKNSGITSLGQKVVYCWGLKN